MINITVTMKPDPATQSLFDRLESALETLTEKADAMGINLADIQREVAENNDAIQSAVTLIGQIAQALRDAAGDQDAVNALANQLDAQSNALAAAVTANTSAAPSA